MDPTVRLKPSGVAWLGDVPEHWEVVRLKKVVTRIEQGWSPQCDAQSAAEGEWGVLKVGCVNQETFDASQNKSLPTSLDPVRALEIRDGDILVSRANTRELLGLAALATKPRDKLILCDKLFRFRPKDPSVDAQFLVYAIRQQTSRAQIESSTNGASDSMQNIGQAVVGSLVLALPPFDEQVRIVEELRHRTGSAARAISLAHHGIALLREYHTHVVADVVTGKVDVREAAFLQEPEEEPTAEEETSLEEGNELGDEPDPHEAFEGVEV